MDTAIPPFGMQALSPVTPTAEEGIVADLADFLRMLRPIDSAPPQTQAAGAAPLIDPGTPVRIAAPLLLSRPLIEHATTPATEGIDPPPPVLPKVAAASPSSALRPDGVRLPSSGPENELVQDVPEPDQAMSRPEPAAEGLQLPTDSPMAQGTEKDRQPDDRPGHAVSDARFQAVLALQEVRPTPEILQHKTPDPEPSAPPITSGSRPTLSAGMAADREHPQRPVAAPPGTDTARRAFRLTEAVSPHPTEPMPAKAPREFFAGPVTPPAQDAQRIAVRPIAQPAEHPTPQPEDLPANPAPETGKDPQPGPAASPTAPLPAKAYKVPHAARSMPFDPIHRTQAKETTAASADLPRSPPTSKHTEGNAPVLPENATLVAPPRRGFAALPETAFLLRLIADPAVQSGLDHPQSTVGTPELATPTHPSAEAPDAALSPRSDTVSTEANVPLQLTEEPPHQPTTAAPPPAEALALSPLPAAPTTSNAPAPQVANTPPPPIPLQVVEAMIAALPHDPDHIELTLRPEELGNLRFDIQRHGHHLQFVLSADRPETLDLMRRHLPELLAELRQAGIDSSSFSFSGWSEGRQPAREDRPVPAGGHMLAENPSSVPVTAPRIETPKQTGLDLRL